LWGFDLSHLDAHLGVLEFRPEFFDVYVELAVEFRLPIRLPGPQAQQVAGFPFRALAEEEGVLFPDDLLHIPEVGARKVLLDAMPTLSPGITEAALHPAVESPELAAMAPDAAARVDDHELLVVDDELRRAVAAAGVTLIGYRPLRDLMRGDLMRGDLERGGA
jgi:hypothetical protein